VVLADRPPKGVKTIHYQDEYEDPRTGKVIPRRVTVTGSDEHGLPTAKDDEVLVGLLYLTKLFNNFTAPTVHFSRRDFLQILKWPEVHDCRVNYYSQICTRNACALRRR
jgi:hypothetical protein